jgi:radical SAM family uncharacterized protein/radical SAM-linked protein
MKMDIQSELLKILPHVRHPSRYIGMEWNRIVKDPHDVELQVVLAFPDGYEIGMSYPGYQILYHILNRRRDVLCERVYAPFPDMENALRDKQLSLFSLESFRPLHDFDVVGVTLQYELHATNLLTILDLGGIHLWAADRTDDDPLVIAGGPCAFNPEPVVPFLDAVVLGDGEESVNWVVEAVIDGKRQRLPREELLKSLSQLPAVYVPQFYHPHYEDGNFTGVSSDADVPATVVSTYVKQLRDDYYPDEPLVPVSEVSHDRLQVEIMRGCTRGCRFCQAGMVYRPLRERSVDSIVGQVIRGLDATGYEELSLVSLSTSDYGQLEELLEELDGTVGDRNIGLSFPSLRPDTFSETMAQRALGGRTGGITFAPEAGTSRLRAVINKAGDEEDLYRACAIALEGGFRRIKLYFMIGLPTETDQDLDGIVDMVRGIFRLPGSHRLQGVTLSISPFVPKAQTPFQRLPQVTGEELQRKIRYLRRCLSTPPYSPPANSRGGERNDSPSASSVGGKEFDYAPANSRGGERHDSPSASSVGGKEFDYAPANSRGGERLGLREKVNALRRIKVDWRDPRVAEIEGVIARGDRRLAKVIYRAWEAGARFCGWTDYFNYDLYQDALDREDLSSEMFLRGIPDRVALPWDHLSKGIKPEFLDREFQKSLDAELSPDCRDGCLGCGLPPGDCFVVGGEGTQKTVTRGRVTAQKEGARVTAHKVESGRVTGHRVRVKYAVRGLLRFLSHLETTRLWERVFRRSGLPVQYSEGYHVRPRISYSPPRPVGVASESEYLDARLRISDPELIGDRLSQLVPDDMAILAVSSVERDVPSLDGSIERYDYVVTFDGMVPDLEARCQELLARDTVEVTRTKKSRQGGMHKKVVDIKSSVASLEIREQRLRISVARSDPFDKPMAVATVREILTELGLEDAQAEITRTGQWIVRNGALFDPVEIN